MKILHISSARALGGGERHLADLVCSLVMCGHDVHVALTPKSPLREELSSALPAGNIITLPLRNSLDVRSAHELARLARRREIEIVHAHMARDYPLASYATRRAPRARFIITRHVLFPLNRLHAWTLSHVARVIAVSGGVARSLQRQHIFPADRLIVIPNGIDVRRFDQATLRSLAPAFRERLGIAKERLLIGTVGEINQLKGQEDFMRAAQLVAQRFPVADFIIAGEDFSRTGEHRARLLKLIAELGLHERVHLAGWLDDVAPLFGSLDLFVSASHTESFGLAIVEALTSGVAVIATATEGARETVEDGVTGLLVPVGDTEALAAAMIKLIEDPRERERLGASGRASAMERYSLERMVTMTQEVYREALESR